MACPDAEMASDSSEAPCPCVANPRPASLRNEDFRDIKQIGKGRDTKIYSATCSKLGNDTVALKVYDKSKLSSMKHRAVKREARIMRQISQRRVSAITRYITAFQDHHFLYIVMEHCAGGDMLEQLLKENRAMSERRVVQEVALPMLTALSQLHALNIVHRDVKLENIFSTTQENGERCTKLGDFGLAVSLCEERAISPVGTLEYMAPEILHLPSCEAVLNGSVRLEDIEGVTAKVDIWSLGVTLYELLTGRSPFEGATKEDIRCNILAHNIRPLPAYLSDRCRSILTQMLQQDPEMRPDAKTLLQDSWITRYSSYTSPSGTRPVPRSHSSRQIVQSQHQPVAPVAHSISTPAAHFAAEARACLSHTAAGALDERQQFSGACGLQQGDCRACVPGLDSPREGPGACDAAKCGSPVKLALDLATATTATTDVCTIAAVYPANEAAAHGAPAASTLANAKLPLTPPMRTPTPTSVPTPLEQEAGCQAWVSMLSSAFGLAL